MAVPALLTATSFLWRRPNFDPIQNQNPWTDWNITWHSWLNPENLPPNEIWGWGDQQGLPGKCEICNLFLLHISLTDLEATPPTNFRTKWLKRHGSTHAFRRKKQTECLMTKNRALKWLSFVFNESCCHPGQNFWISPNFWEDSFGSHW